MTLDPAGQETSLEPHADAALLNLFRGILNGEAGANPSLIHNITDPELRALCADLELIRSFTNSLAQGDLSSSLPVRGQMAGSLKTLQANLRHLTWQVQQVAQGDFTQKVDFMGEFSRAFQQMTDSLHQARVEEIAQRLIAEALRDTAAALNSALGLDQILEVILTQLGQVVPHDTLTILLVDDEIARVVRAQGYEQMAPEITRQVEQLRLPIREIPNLREMNETGQPCRIADIDTYGWVILIEEHWAHSFLGAPIMLEGRAVGFLNLMSARRDFFTEQHARDLMAFANQAAVSIHKVRLIERLHQLATTDSLTGIANRRYFFDEAARAFSHAQRYHEPLSALMLDIDHFKKVNDTYGHAAGDETLQGVVKLFLRELRSADLLGRYGGEEFAILLPATRLSDAFQAAERLRCAVGGHNFVANERVFHVTLSIGVAQMGGPDDNLAALLERADQGLYRAKQAGRNRCVSVEGE